MWDPQSRKIVRNHNVFFDQIKMHKKLVKTVEIQKVVFQEEGPVPREIHVGKLALPPQR